MLHHVNHVCVCPWYEQGLLKAGMRGAVHVDAFGALCEMAAIVRILAWSQITVFRV